LSPHPPTHNGAASTPGAATAIAAALGPRSGPADADDTRDNPERAAEALAELCGFALARAPGRVLPESGGRRPQLVVTVQLDDIERRARAATLEFGGQPGPAALRMLACDAAVLPVVFGGDGRPVDVDDLTAGIGGR